MIHRLRNRRRLARLIARAHGVSNAVKREWRWVLRDVRDLKSELGRYRVRVMERIRDPEPYVRDDALRDELCALERQLVAHEREVARG